MATFFHHRCFVVQLLLVNFILLRFAVPLLNASSTSGQLLPHCNPNYAHWVSILGGSAYMGSKQAVMQSIVASSMVDSNGDLYSVIFYEINSEGASYYIVKHSGDNPSTYESIKEWKPWKDCFDKEVPKEPHWPTSGDPVWFKRFFFNALQPCIAQELEGETYVYVVIYVPITRLYTNDNDTGNFEGYVVKKFIKTNLSEPTEGVEKLYRYTYNTCPRDKFGLATGNIQAWHEKDDLHLHYIHLKEPKDASTAWWKQTYYSSGSWIDVDYPNGKESPGDLAEASSIALQPRAIKYEDCVYQFASRQAAPFIAKMQIKRANIDHWIDGKDPLSQVDKTSKSYLVPSGINIGRCWDFCIVDNPYSRQEPIFCVLGLQCPDAGTNPTLISQNNKLWNSSYANWGKGQVVLLLSSIPWNTNEWRTFSAIGFGPEDPQNIIYSTSFTIETSSKTLAVGYSSDQLYYNTHKLCTYTSPSGKNYIIYCYCYPGKERKLYLGYAQYAVRKNSNGTPKVCLLTKCERCVSTTCNRIFHMDCKNDHLWITWIGGSSSSTDDSTYYYYHIKASELIQE